MASLIPLPNKVVSRSAKLLILHEVLDNFDHSKFEQATTKYRKPSYQRFPDRDEQWKRKLIESLLYGRSIGTFTLSKHNVIKSNEEGGMYNDEYYNIEDGQTRLCVLSEFKNGGFTTIYGNYQDVYMRFDEYILPVELMEKASQSITDETYFNNLCENFQLLQEGKSLNTNDRLWAQYRSPAENFAGSPIVNYVVDLVNSNDNFNTYMGLRGLDKKTKMGRAKLDISMSVVSGAWKGGNYMTNNYFNKVPIMDIPLLDVDIQEINKNLGQLFNILEELLIQYPHQKNEKFVSYFNNTQMFIGPMLIDIRNCDDDEFEKTKKRWTTVINYARKESQINETKFSVRDCLERDMYQELSHSNRRNCSEQDFDGRLNAIHAWYERNR